MQSCSSNCKSPSVGLLSNGIRRFQVARPVFPNNFGQVGRGYFTGTGSAFLTGSCGGIRIIIFPFCFINCQTVNLKLCWVAITFCFVCVVRFAQGSQVSGVGQLLVVAVVVQWNYVIHLLRWLRYPFQETNQTKRVSLNYFFSRSFPC